VSLQSSGLINLGEIWDGVIEPPCQQDNNTLLPMVEKNQVLIQVQALAHVWPDLLLYAYPPLPLIWAFLRRVQERQHRLLIAPYCPTMFFFFLSFLVTRRLNGSTSSVAPLGTYCLRWMGQYGTQFHGAEVVCLDPGAPVLIESMQDSLYGA